MHSWCAKALRGTFAAFFIAFAAAPAPAQIDLRPPQRPATAPRATPAPPASAPGSAAEPRGAGRLTPEQLGERIIDLRRRTAACDAAAQKVIDIVTPELDENGECDAHALQQFHDEAEQAETLIAATCPDVVEYEDIRRDVAGAIAELEEQQRTFDTDSARSILQRRIDLLRESHLFIQFALDEQTLRRLRGDLRGKVHAVDEIVRACRGEASDARARADPEYANLVDAAKREGTLTVMALPRDWCGYGKLIDSFRQQYGIAVVERDPQATSDDQIAALANGGKDAPDVVEISFLHARQATEAGLLRPYRVATWDTIPEGAKDPGGHWYGDYFYAVVFAVNVGEVASVPRDWGDLLAPAYRRSVALAGHPHRTNEALLGVYAAGVAAAGGRSALAGEAGLRFFADLRQAGNLLPTAGSALTLAEGVTPIVIRLEHAARTDRDKLSSIAPIEIIIPRTGVVATAYAQAINARARSPNAAKLWMEHVFSDEGQIAFLEGNCNPIRLRDLADRGKLPDGIRGVLPSAYDSLVFPDPVEQGRARQTIFNEWNKVVGLEID